MCLRKNGTVWQFSEMAKIFRTYFPERSLLLPASLREWLPDDHLSYFVTDVVDQLNLSAIESVYEEEDRGQPPYHPRMMTKILVYGYCVGVFSSRRIQKRLVEDVAFRVLAAGNQPFRTIADFRGGMIQKQPTTKKKQFVTTRATESQNMQFLDPCLHPYFLSRCRG
jgi:transposase